MCLQTLSLFEHNNFLDNYDKTTTQMLHDAGLFDDFDQKNGCR